MEITLAQLEKYRLSARQHEAKRLEKLAARRERAWALARRAAAMLKEEFGAKRVVLFGSLNHPELYHGRSDVDLVVWDIQHYYRAVAHLLDLDTEIGFDLVPVEDASPAILELIAKEGVDL